MSNDPVLRTPEMNRDEYERALATAEALQDRLDRERMDRARDRGHLVAWSVLVVAGIGVGAPASVPPLHPVLRAVLVILLWVLCAGVAAALVAYLQMRQRDEAIRRDERALHQIVTLLRETSSAMTWPSPLAASVFRARLARFEVGSKDHVVARRPATEQPPASERLRPESVPPT